MKIEKIKPIPKYMLKKIQSLDKKYHPEQDKHRRFYSYLTKNDGELVKVTVACINQRKNWYCKQVAIHGIDSSNCFVKDMKFTTLGGYSVGWFEEGLQSYPKWYEGEWGWIADKYFDPFALPVNPEYALSLKEFKYSAVNLHTGENTIKYLRLYRNYPYIEMLTKLGLHRYVNSVQLLRLANKDKRFRKFICKNAEVLRNNRYYVQSIVKAYRQGMPIDDVDKRIKLTRELCCKDYYPQIKELFKEDNQALIEYLIKQKVSIAVYYDYFKACRKLGLDLSIERNLFPKDFYHWHNVRIDEYRTQQAIKDERQRKELFDKFLTVSNKYFSMEHKNNAFAVVIAKSPTELKTEGKALHHCVGSMGYEQKVVREESLIFFVRNIEDIKVPFVTIEYSLKNKQILQCYGEHNTRPNEDVLDYINKKWLPYTKRQLKKIAA